MVRALVLHGSAAFEVISGVPCALFVTVCGTSALGMGRIDPGGCLCTFVCQMQRRTPGACTGAGTSGCRLEQRRWNRSVRIVQGSCTVHAWFGGVPGGFGGLSLHFWRHVLGSRPRVLARLVRECDRRICVPKAEVASEACTEAGWLGVLPNSVDGATPAGFREVREKKSPDGLRRAANIGYFYICARNVDLGATRMQRFRVSRIHALETKEETCGRGFRRGRRPAPNSRGIMQNEKFKMQKLKWKKGRRGAGD